MLLVKGKRVTNAKPKRPSRQVRGAGRFGDGRPDTWGGARGMGHVGEARGRGTWGRRLGESRRLGHLEYTAHDKTMFFLTIVIAIKSLWWGLSALSIPIYGIKVLPTLVTYILY